MSYFETKNILEIAFMYPLDSARVAVFAVLKDLERTEPEFFDAIEEHAKDMKLTSEQWLRIFQMYPSSVFHKRFEITKLLSEDDLQKLRPQM